MTTPLQAPTYLVRLFRAGVDQLVMSPFLRGTCENQPQPSGFDEALHRLVAVSSAGDVVGYVDVWKPPESDCAELTIARDRGPHEPAHFALIAESVKHAAAQGASSLLAYVETSDELLADLLLQTGFEQGEGYRQMKITLEETPDVPVWPGGWILESLEESADDQLLIDACNHCYAGLWGHKPATSEDVDVILEAFPRDGILLLTDTTDQVIGIFKAKELTPGEDGSDCPTGYLDAPGLAAPFRNRIDLYQAMTRAALGWLYSRGHRQVLLDSWGDPGSVRQAYAEMGFSTEKDIPAYVLRIDRVGLP